MDHVECGDTFDDAGAVGREASLTFCPHLFVVLECDRLDASGARYALEGIDAITIGRGSERATHERTEGGITTLDVRVPGRSMSSNHVRLVKLSEGWSLHDLGSRNGTFVDGKLERTALVRSGQVFDAGHTLFTVQDALPRQKGSQHAVDARTSPVDRFVTLDPALETSLLALERIAPSLAPILVLGSSGTGKELVAREVHHLTGRGGPFVAVNCGAIPATLLDSHVFGHRKGAFSGAVSDEPGLVRAAHGGTLFLDEVGDLPILAQAALLRVLQEREVLPVGATRPIPVDVRVVAATHLPIAELVQQGRFREDLFARLAAHFVTLPVLAERRCDLGLLIARLLARRAGRESTFITVEAGRAIARYRWPLNVRELEQCVTTSVALAEGRAIDVGDLPERMRASEVSITEEDEDAALRRALLEQLSSCGGNVSEVARRMGKARMQIQRWCRRLGITPERYRSG